jgi:hypothetical protein
MHFDPVVEARLASLAQLSHFSVSPESIEVGLRNNPPPPGRGKPVDQEKEIKPGEENRAILLKVCR